MSDTNDPKHIRGLGNNIAPPRFLLFVAVLIGTTLFLARSSPWGRSFLVGFDTATIVFLLSLYPLLNDHTQAQMRNHSLENDANRILLLAIAIVVLLAILGAVGLELNVKAAPNIPVVVGTLTLAWFFASTVFALHYAHEYYAEGSGGGLDFPGNPDAPDYTDFVYFAYTLGMAFATSDVQIVSRRMRQVATIHCLAAFAFNIGVLAFSVNTISGAGH